MQLKALVMIFGWLLLWAPAAHGFDFSEVVAKARSLAEKPYQPPAAIPRFLQNLSYQDYQKIRFKPQQSLWRAGGTNFQVMLISPGLYYKHAVKINVVEGTEVHRVRYEKSDFTFPSHEFASRIPSDLGYAGFKLTYPLKNPDVQSQFLVFAGSSYFRGVGRDNAFGISARGIAIDTGLQSGEQFPSFIEYWLVRPEPQAPQMRFYALLNGESLTGAYRFTVIPGAVTRLQVKLVLFMRKPVQLLGIAPLTSMFYYGENTPRPVAQWRPQVHDSDGLLLHNGTTGEWLWRPLLNPQQLGIDYFATEDVRGFGLLQRQTRFRDYQDGGARYDKRPSAWVTPKNGWGAGNVVLVQLPSASETEDNIVAFWSPKEKVLPGKPIEHSYTLHFGDRSLVEEAMGQAIQTFVGSGNVIGGGTVKGAYRLIVDFSGGPLDRLPVDSPVTAVVTAEEAGSVLEQSVAYVKPLRQWRLSILAKPATGKPLVLRAFLKEKQQTLTETWTYHLPWHNKIGGQGR